MTSRSPCSSIFKDLFFTYEGGQKKALDFLGSGVTERVVSCLAWVLEPNTDPLQEQYVLLMADLFP